MFLKQVNQVKGSQRKSLRCDTVDSQLKKPGTRLSQCGHVISVKTNVMNAVLAHNTHTHTHTHTHTIHTANHNTTHSQTHHTGSTACWPLFKIGMFFVKQVTEFRQLKCGVIHQCNTRLDSIYIWLSHFPTKVIIH